MGNRLIFIVVLSICSHFAISQNEINCLKKTDGYIIKIYQKETEKNVSVSSDYFYFKTLPDFKKINTPIDFLDNGGILIDKNYMSFVNMDKRQQAPSSYKEFYESKPYIEEKGKSFNVSCYRVIFAHFTKDEKLSDYIKASETSNTYSYFTNADADKKEKVFSIMYPDLVMSW